MTKARSSRKSGGKAQKVGKVKAGKARSAKATPSKPAARAAKAPREPLVSARVVRERKAPGPVEIPEIPPPLPAPIASFTF